MHTVKLLLYFTPLALIWIALLRKRMKTEAKAAAVKEAAVRDGLVEPPSLHPIINESRCIGCRSCVAACPEQPEHQVLGMIGGKAHLVNPSDCIGHGACKEVCPVDAIQLVFGTAKRGIDIPVVSKSFETNIPGVFICGELGGMGLIRNAIEQGRQALESIKKSLKPSDQSILDVLIIGAGPAGFSASLSAMQSELRFVTLEQDSLGGTVAHYPRGKVVMTSPAELPMFGKVKFTVTTKEELLDLWQNVANQTKVKINYEERMQEIARTKTGFVVKTNRSSYQTQTVLLAVGRRGSPRKLDVPGEDLPKVVYRLVDPAQYQGRRVLVVGGGDSALEAATSIADEPGTVVTLSYRADAFSRAKAKNRDKVLDAAAAGSLTVLFESTVSEIHTDHVQLKHRDKTITIDNDAIIICVGGILPTKMLKSLGVQVETKYGTP